MSYKNENAERYTNISKVNQFVYWVDAFCDSRFHRDNVHFLLGNYKSPISWLSFGVSEFCDCIKTWNFNKDGDTEFTFISIAGYIPLGKYLRSHLPELNEAKSNEFCWKISIESIIENFETLKQHLA